MVAMRETWIRLMMRPIWSQLEALHLSRPTGLASRAGLNCEYPGGAMAMANKVLLVARVVTRGGSIVKAKHTPYFRTVGGCRDASRRTMGIAFAVWIRTGSAWVRTAFAKSD